MPSASIRKCLPFYHLSLSLSLKHTHTLSLSLYQANTPTHTPNLFLTHTLAHTLSQSFSYSLSPDFLQNEVKIVTLNLMTSSFLLLCRDFEVLSNLRRSIFFWDTSADRHTSSYTISIFVPIRCLFKLLDQLKCFIPPIFFLSAQPPIKSLNGRLGILKKFGRNRIWSRDLSVKSWLC